MRGKWARLWNAPPHFWKRLVRINYDPILAETLLLRGNMMVKAGDSPAAEKSLMEALLAADASRHDEVRAEAAAGLVFAVGYQQGRVAEGERWADAASAILRRINGHQLLQAWLLNDIGCVYDLEGKKEAAIRALTDGLALKEKALGRLSSGRWRVRGKSGPVPTWLGTRSRGIGTY